MPDSTNRIQGRLERSRAKNGVTLLPYLTAGYPDAASMAAIIRRADQLGAPVVEIGFPYSDSIADGPVIQGSFHHVLEKGHTLSDTFDLVTDLRSSISCGLVAMVSFSIVHRFGVEAFMGRAASAGFEGVILPDVPAEESMAIAASVLRARLCHIGLVAPTTSSTRRALIIQQSSGFIYQMAVAGTTGERTRLAAELPRRVADLRRVSGLPVCVGFGVSTPAQVRDVCRFADGAIVGSAIVHRIERGLRAGMPLAAIVDSVGGFLAELMGGGEPPGA